MTFTARTEHTTEAARVRHNDAMNRVRRPGVPDEPAERPGESSGSAAKGAREGRAERKSGRRLLRLVAAAVRLAWSADRRLLLVTAGLQLVGAVLLATQIVVIKLVLDAILHSQPTHESVRDTLLPISLLALAIAASTVTTAIQQQWLRLLAELVSRATWDDILDVSTSVGLQEFERPAFYDRLQRVQSNAIERPHMVTQGLLNLIGGAASTVGLSLALLTLQPLLLPLLLISGIPLYLATRRGSTLEFSFVVAQTPRLRLRQYLTEVQTGRGEAQEVRAFGTSGVLRRRYNQVYDTFVSDLRQHVRRRSLIVLFGSLASSAVLAGTMLVIVWLVSRHELSLSEAGAAIIGVRVLAAQITAMFGSIQQIFESGLFLEDLQGFLAMGAAARDDGKRGAPAPPSFQQLDVEALTYSYPASETPALRGVNLHIRAGEVIALVGENGSGKTTLAKLLANLYPPDAGVIRWDGVDVTTYQGRDLGRSIAVIFQDFSHYQLSARDNIRFGRPDSEGDDVGVALAADRAGATELIADLPHGYDTILSKAFVGGQELSLGQWQRIALARAFYRNAPFVILDEPSASLDPRAEYELFSSLRHMLAGRTVLFISHRLSTVRDADRIYVLAHGQVIEDGTHEQLMALGGHYAELFLLQAAAYLESQSD